MYRIALVSPPYGDGSTDSMRPLGLMAIYSYIGREFGDQIEVVLHDYSDCDADDVEQMRRDGLDGCDLVGFCAYSTNFPVVRKWALALRDIAPKATSVVGGPHATAMPEYLVWKHRDAFDFVIRGEGERPLAALIRAKLDGTRLPRTAGLLYKDPLGVVSVGTTDPVKDLNTVPIPLAPVQSPYEHKLICYDAIEDRERQAVAFTTSRGCPFSCTFCSIRASDSKWRAVGPERLSDWISAAVKDDPEIEHVNFMDADFLINVKRVVAIGEMFQTTHPNLTWSFSARVDDLKRLGDSALEKLVTQGLRAVEVGFESGSQEMLDLMGKRVTVQDNYDAIAMLQRLRLDILIDFILFVPDETPEQLQESLDFIRSAGLTEYMPHGHLFTSLIQYPATPLRKRYEEVFDTKFSMDELPLPDDLFTHEGTLRIYRYFVKEFGAKGAAKVSSMVGEIDAFVASCPDRELAQRLRIEAVSLRHLPFQILESLIRAHHTGELYEGDSLVDVLPWLNNFEAHLAEIHSVIRQSENEAA